MWLCFWLSITLTFLCYALILPSPLSNVEFSLLYLELSPLHTACCHCDKRQKLLRVLFCPSYLLHHHPSKPAAPVKHQKPEICLFTWGQLPQIYVTSRSPAFLSCPKSPQLPLISCCCTNGKYWAESRFVIKYPYQGSHVLLDHSHNRLLPLIWYWLKENLSSTVTDLFWVLKHWNLKIKDYSNICPGLCIVVVLGKWCLRRLSYSLGVLMSLASYTCQWSNSSTVLLRP